MALPKAVPDNSAWEAQHLQLIAFPTVPPTTLEQNWWRDLTGHEPDESVIKKKLERTDQGVYESRAISVNTDVLKITWMMFPKIKLEDLIENAIQTLGGFSEAQDWFVGLMSKWLEKGCPPIKRLAFAGALVQRAEDNQSSCAQIGRYLPGIELDPESTDFNYRINRKRESATVPNLSINRLTTWQVAKFSVRLQGSAPNIDAEPITTPPVDLYACALNFDINTAQEHVGLLPQDKLPAIFNELSTLASEIAQRGDVR